MFYEMEDKTLIDVEHVETILNIGVIHRNIATTSARRLKFVL